MEAMTKTSEQRAKILIIDDDEPTLEVIAEHVRLSNYDVFLARNGMEGLQAMRANRPDLIVCDIMMPEMDGYEFYEIVRQNPAWAAIPIIFLSAKAEQNDIQKGYILGVDHYLTKPFDPEDLLIQMRSRLKRAADIQTAVESDLDRAKKNLLNVFGHELRTPLNQIYTYLEIFQKGKSKLDDVKADEISLVMQRTVNRMVKLVEDIMLITYIDSGATEVEIQRLYQPIDLALEIDVLIDEFSEPASGRNIKLSKHVPAELHINGHAHFIREIFRRLLDNAIKFSNPDGTIWIEAKHLREGVLVSVRDDGMGISKDQKTHIFNRFSQVDRVKIERQGVGLGLAIASRLTRLHGGEIEVESTLGLGSTFKVWLPTNLGED